MQKTLIKKNDILLVAVLAAVCAAALCLLRFSGASLTAVVTVDGRVIEAAELDKVEESYTVVTDTVPQTVIRFERSAVYFESSQCENQLCVKAGRLTRRGATAACLPAKTVITIVDGKKTVDAVTY